MHVSSNLINLSKIFLEPGIWIRVEYLFHIYEVLGSVLDTKHTQVLTYFSEAVKY